MNSNTVILAKLKTLPFGLGLWIFSRVLCIKAPYFSSIHPTFTELSPGRGEAAFKNRRKVRNHLGGVHAIAMANLCEFVAGVTLEVTLPSSHRWIPKSMKINYLAQATTDVRARASIDLGDLPDKGIQNVCVEVTDAAGKLVVTAEIEMYISRRKGTS
ncbi:MAG: hotdog fold domain-containing protein [Bdellovibrionales bacterium]